MASFLHDVWTEWRLGLRRSLLPLLRPVASFKAVWQARSALRELRRLLTELSVEGSVVVATPAAAPLLRSQISALGDVTLQVAGGVALPAATIAEHQRAVRERLGTVDELSTVGALAHGVVTALPLLVGAGSGLWEARDAVWSEARALLEIFPPFAIGTLISALLATSRRWVFRWTFRYWLHRLGA